MYYLCIYVLANITVSVIAMYIHKSNLESILWYYLVLVGHINSSLYLILLIKVISLYS